MSPAGLRRARFGVFDIDLAAREIRKHGTRIRLQDQPFDVLCALIERPGELVTREDLRDRLWPNDTFVDFDQSVNKAVNKLREALGDSATHPIYIETLARRGYRFLVPVEREQPSESIVQTVAPAAEPAVPGRRNWVWLATGVVALVAVLATGLWPIDVPQVVRVVQLTHDGTGKGLVVADGVRVIYSDGIDVWSVPVSGGEPKRLPLAFLPKGRGYVWLSGYAPLGQQTLLVSWGSRKDGAGELWLTGPDGDTPRKVGEIPSVFASVVLSPDADRLAISLPDGLYTQVIATGERRKVQSMKWSGQNALWWHPSGHSLGFLDDPGNDSKTWAWQVNDDGTRLRRIVPEWEQTQGPGVWSKDGKRFFYVSLDQNRENPHRTEAGILEWPHQGGEIYLRTQAGIRGWMRKSVVTRLTASGQLGGWPAIDPVDPKRLYAAGWAPRAETMRYDRKSGKWVPFLAGFSGDQIDRSPDGEWLVYLRYPSAELHKCRIDGSSDLLLASGVTSCNPKWSPDGKRIAFAGRPSGTNKNLNLWMVSAGGGDAAPYHLEIDVGYDVIWSKDGKRILFAQGGDTPDALPPGESRIRILDLETGKLQVIPKGDSLFSPRWSPDEKQLLAMSVYNGRVHVFDGAKSEWRELTAAPVQYPAWSPDGKWVYAFDHLANAVIRVEAATGRREEIVRPDFRIAANWAEWVGWTGDGDPVMLRDLGSNEIFRIDLDR